MADEHDDAAGERHRQRAIQRERDRWRGVRSERPARIEVSGSRQESVWDYPRPPRVEPVARCVRVELGGVVLAETTRALRVVETARPPAYYLPPPDVRREHLHPGSRRSFCEWKGSARYWSIRVGERIAEYAAWSYPEPDAGYDAIRDYFAFFPGRMDACFVGDQRVEPQPGDYYGGWITPEIVGPFKGEPGTESW